jgi:protein-tyrosine phosphatase
MLISKLTWMEMLKLIGLMIIGYRLDAIKVLAPTMNGMGLVGLAISSLDVCTKEVKQVFDFLGDESNWPTLVHCTQGKDRTGLIVQLLLFLLHVDVSAINADYMLSGPELEGERKERVEEISKIGLGEEFAVCSPGVVTKVHEHIQEKYGSVEEYLVGAGVEAETVERIKRILRAEE